MKKLILISLFCLSISNIFSQITFGYNPADTSWHNLGNWSGIDMYIQKDSFPNPYSSYWRFNTRIIEARNLNASFPNKKHDTVLVLDPNGRFYKMSIIDMSLSAPQITTALGAIPLFSEIDGSITNELQTLSLSGNTVTLSNSGGSFVVPSGSTLTGITSSTGISITNGSVITNTAPDRTVNIIAGQNISIAGSYPNYTVSSAKREELYSGTTNTLGVYSVTFATAYSVAPNIQASITNQSNVNQYLRISNISTTGFTINVFQRGSINILGTDVLLYTTANVSSATVDILIKEK